MPVLPETLFGVLHEEEYRARETSVKAYKIFVALIGAYLFWGGVMLYLLVEIFIHITFETRKRLQSLLKNLLKTLIHFITGRLNGISW